MVNGKKTKMTLKLRLIMIQWLSHGGFPAP